MVSKREKVEKDGKRDGRGMFLKGGKLIFSKNLYACLWNPVGLSRDNTVSYGRPA